MASSNDDTQRESRALPLHQSLHPDDLSMRAPLSAVLQENYDQDIRALVCRMFVACNTLRIGVETRSTALVLFHRFHAAISVVDKDDSSNKCDSNDQYKSIGKRWAAAACIFLACKAEEEPRRLRDIINVSDMILKEPTTEITASNAGDGAAVQKDASDYPNESPQSATASATAGTATKPSDQTLTLQVQSDSRPLDAMYWAAKELIVHAEQVVLRWLGFDVSVSKPHRLVALLVQEPPLAELLQIWNAVTPSNLVPVAWRRLNDSVFYAEALQHSALELACASLELAIMEQKVQREIAADRTDTWWLELGVSDNSIALTKQHLNDATRSLQTGFGLAKEESSAS
jgi:hypothetical protein